MKGTEIWVTVACTSLKNRKSDEKDKQTLKFQGPGVSSDHPSALCRDSSGRNIIEFEEEHKATPCDSDVSWSKNEVGRRCRRSGRCGLVEDALQVLGEGQDDSFHVRPQSG